MKKLEEENRVLRKQLGISQKTGWQMIPALVLDRNRFLKIDKGRREGVEKGAAVVFENIFLGRVLKVEEFSSVVQLVSDPNSKILAKTDKGARGILVGSYQAGMQLTKVLGDAPLSSDDLVLVQNQEGVPPNFLLGKVGKVFKDNSQLFQRAEVLPILDISDLEIVFVTLQK